MTSRYLDMARRNTRKNGTMQITGRSVLFLLALISMVASAIYWWGVQSELTTSRPIAIAFTAILVLAPPTLISFLIPWSPAGMLLQRVNAQTYGHAVVVFASIYLLYYSYQLQYSWWAAQQVTAESGLIWQQVGIGIIGFILIPALLWAPVSSEELTAQVEQAHIVKRYELQTQADIAILRATLLRAQEKALIGFANLTVDEREELAAVMRSLVGGIDKTLREVGQSVQKVSGASLPFSGMLDDNDDIRDVLDYIGESLTGSTLHVADDHSVKLPSPAARENTTQLVRMRDLPSRESAQVIDQAFDQAAAAHVRTRSQSSIPRAHVSDQAGPSRTQSDQIYEAIARDLPSVFTAADVSTRMQWTDKREGQRVIRAWLDEGVAKEVRLGRYSLTESEA
jgi:hypothetical protein